MISKSYVCMCFTLLIYISQVSITESTLGLLNLLGSSNDKSGCSCGGNQHDSTHSKDWDILKSFTHKQDWDKSGGSGSGHSGSKSGDSGERHEGGKSNGHENGHVGGKPGSSGSGHDRSKSSESGERHEGGKSNGHENGHVGGKPGSSGSGHDRSKSSESGERHEGGKSNGHENGHVGGKPGSSGSGNDRTKSSESGERHEGGKSNGHENGHVGGKSDSVHDGQGHTQAGSSSQGEQRGNSNGNNNNRSSLRKRIRRPSRPVLYDGSRDHQIIKTDGDFIHGRLKIKGFRPSLLTRQPSRSKTICGYIEKSLKSHLTGLGILNKFHVELEHVGGSASDLEFDYKVDCSKCDKSRQQQVSNGLISVCQLKGLSDILTEVKQPKDDESSSQSCEARSG